VISESIAAPTEKWGYVKGGDIAAGLAAGLKSYLGMRGAMQDMSNQQAYNDYLAQMAEQDRQDKLGQQAFENDLKDRALAQEAQLAENQLNAKADEFERQKELEGIKHANALELQNAQIEREKNIYDRNRADALADAQTKRNFDLALLNQKAKNDKDAEMLKGLDAIAQKRLNAEDYALWRQNPDAFDITGDGWFSRKVGRKASITPKNQPVNINGFTIVEE
jgi:hypothetical protein